MSIGTSVKRLCEYLGKHNKATYVMVSVAAAKGIFRPIFTMADTKESPETKKYTAWREGLTELCAVPIYMTTDRVVSAVSKNLVKNKEVKIGGVKASRMAESNLNLFGICLAGGLLIPAACFMIVRPITAKMFKDKALSQTVQKLDVVAKKPEKPVFTPTKLYPAKSDYTFKPAAIFNSSNMKVGL